MRTKFTRKFGIKRQTFHWFAEYGFKEGAERDAFTLRERGYLVRITKSGGYRQLWYRHKTNPRRHPRLIRGVL